MKIYILTSITKLGILLFLIIPNCYGQSVLNQPTLGVVSKQWDPAYGNHRAVLLVDKPAQAICLNLLWRRHDPNPEKKRFIIINAIDNDTIQNIYRIRVNKDSCSIVFGPVLKTGTYYFYYLPFKQDHKAGSYRYGYYPPEDQPSKAWVKENGLQSTLMRENLPKAKVKKIQARTKFSSFYPMEIIPTKEEKRKFLDKYTKKYLIFPEYRTYPIKMRDEIPLRWISKIPGEPFRGKALRNEYFVFQLGIYASKIGLKNVKIRFSNFISSRDTIYSSSLTCFNTEGIDTYGKYFTKNVHVGKDSVQAFWIGIDIPKNIKSDNYEGMVLISPENAPSQKIPVYLKVIDSILANRGDNQPWRLSRIRWLNSRLGINDKPTRPFTPIKSIKPYHFRLYGKQISLKKNGLPEEISSFGTNILHHGISYIVKSDSGEENINSSGLEFNKESSPKIMASWTSYSNHFKVDGKSELEFDGHINYSITLTPKEDIKLTDFILKIPFRTEVAEYLMGMGLPGMKVPERKVIKWEGPYDSFWIGNTYGGLQLELKGKDVYHGPMLNLYNPPKPPSWYNNGDCQITIEKRDNEVLATVSSGARKLRKDEKITFEFSLIITPVKKINLKDQFINRYYQDAGGPLHSKEGTRKLLNDGVKVINVHQGNQYNPFINYPLIATKKLQQVVDYWHKRNVKVKVYYTDRELTNHLPELWALRSLGNEILDVKGVAYKGDFPWLRAHMINGYKPRWYTPINLGNGKWIFDASVLTVGGNSRLDNFYVAAINWLVRNIGIDGVYLDDVSYNRQIIKRVRRVLDHDKSNGLIDLHSNTDFSKGPAMQYLSFFPYINKLWFGEHFDYEKMSPAQWLVESSGIPFGLMGDMLQGGGNPWKGMVYGMTARYHMNSDGVKPHDIWEIWDRFGIAEAKMVGYWDHNPIITVNDPKMRATAYVRKDKVLISIASWATKKKKIKLNINWERIGISPNNVTIMAPAIENFQPYRTFSKSQAITIEPGKGWLLVVKPK